jgi:hypothetical protein
MKDSHKEHSMDGIELSILIPTRGRTQKMRHLFENIMETAANPSALELILYIDDDDPMSHGLDHPSLGVKRLIRPRQPMGAMLHACFQASSGPFILVIGDDNLFRTKGWDLMILDGFSHFPDGIALVYGDDLIQGRNMCTAPAVSRKFCEILGGLCPPEYTGEFIDTHILDLFTKLRCWGFDRIIYLENLVIEHMHHVVGKSEYDETYARQNTTDENRNRYFGFDAFRVGQARELVKYMASMPDAAKYKRYRNFTA